MTVFYPGLMPWHLDEMTLREVNEYLTQMAEWKAAHPEGG